MIPIGLIVGITIFIIRMIARSSANSRSRTNYCSAPRYPNSMGNSGQGGYGLDQLGAPNPLMAAPVNTAVWYFHETEVIRQMTWPDFLANVAAGRIRADTLVIRDGMTDWMQANQVQGLTFPRVARAN